MTAYLWTKTAHLVFVIAWMAAVFYLPRILVNLAEVGDVPAVRERLVLMGRRLYRFGHVMFGSAVALGFVLWLGYRVSAEFPAMVAPGSGREPPKVSATTAVLLAVTLMSETR